jgi:hypothetical protein
LEKEILAFLTDQNSTEFERLIPLETTTQNVEITTTLIANSSIYILQEPDLNQKGNKTETDTNNQEKDKKINNFENILITQPEDGEKSGITDAIDDLIVDKEYMSATTTKLPVSSTSTTYSTTQETTSTTPISGSTSPTTQKTTTTTPNSSSTTPTTQKTTIPPNITSTSTTPATTSSTPTTTIKIITSSSTTP